MVRKGTCYWCAHDFSVDQKGPVPTYCSVECKGAMRIAKRGRVLRLRKKCHGCGMSVALFPKNTQRCDPCRIERRKQMGMYVPEIVTKACGRCGVDYVTSRPTGKYCSRRCGQKANSTRKRHRRRAAYSEPYELGDIFARDGWVCQLCHLPVSRSTSFPNRESASVDHIVPTSLGGDDTPMNVQLAHLGCNSAKGARAAGSQLRLVG